MRSLHIASLLLFAAATASASGTHVRWNTCYGDGGVENRFFACDTNTGSEQLVCTFMLTDAIPGVWQIDGFVNAAFDGTAIPAWWGFKSTGSCRSNALAVVTTPPLGASACVDWAGGLRDAFVTYQTSFAGPNTAQLEVVSPLLPSAPFDLAAGQEYLAFTAVINHQRTVGTGACAGCSLGACMGFVGVKLVRTPPAASVSVPPGDILISPDALLGQVVTWQGGSGIAIPNFGGAGWTYCPGATPARSSTWGSVKALYR